MDQYGPPIITVSFVIPVAVSRPGRAVESNITPSTPWGFAEELEGEEGRGIR